MANGDLVEEINRLKNQTGGDIIAYGGAGFVSSLINYGLIDEYHFLINPTLLGKGMKIFDKNRSKQNLELVYSENFKCGILVVNYTQKR